MPTEGLCSVSLLQAYGKYFTYKVRRFGALYFLLFGGEVMIRINGVDIDKIEISLMQYLEENSISPQRIAVELNEEILPKANYAATVLKDGDVVEIVNFVGGGC